MKATHRVFQHIGHDCGALQNSNMPYKAWWPGGGGGGRQKNTDLEHLEAKLGVLSGGCSSSTGLAFVQ